MQPTSFSYQSMGTSWEITIWDKIDDTKLKKIKKQITSGSRDFDKTFSRFKPNSFITKVSKKKGKIKVPKDFVKMLELYFDLYDLSEKKVNPLIGQALSDMGYDSNYSLRPKEKISKVPDLKKMVSIIDDENVFTTIPLLFDFGALGKGYFVDRIKDILEENNIERFLVNGSGDIYYKGPPNSLRAGLEHPMDDTKVIGVINMGNGAMCASSGNRRKWRNYHHIINPITLAPANEIIATWVMADNAALSDALATCLFFVSPKNFENKFKFEYLILNKEMRVKKSEGFAAELF
ncbi:MAG TPA: FAD:protein FMN transferase [Patescibacteria group bacterium]|nr:FAD:protein FMN transferase [Patescibacteria group bacterium]